MNTPFFNTLVDALMTSKPSVAIEELRDSGELGREVPELIRMIGSYQNRDYHLEDVWEHTMMVIDLAAAVKNQASDPVRFMLGALLHDSGKPVTRESHIDAETGEKVYSNIGHPAAGAYVADMVLRRLTDDRELIDYVFDFIGYHHVIYEIDHALMMRRGVVCGWEVSGDAVDERVSEMLKLKDMRDYILFNREADSRGVVPGRLSFIRPDRFLAAYAKIDPDWAAKF